MAKTHFIWNSVTDNVLMETDDTGAVQATYTQEPSLYGSVVSQKRGDETSYYHFDGQRSTRQLTDENQDVTDTATYSAFGEEVEKTGTTENPWGYKGALGYYAGQSPSDDLYVRARHLVPSLGRWLSVDPLGFVDGSNLYLSTFNNPFLADPSGMFCEEAGDPQQQFDDCPRARIPAIPPKCMNSNAKTTKVSICTRPIRDAPIGCHVYLKIECATLDVYTYGGVDGAPCKQCEDYVKAGQLRMFFGEYGKPPAGVVQKNPDYPRPGEEHPCVFLQVNRPPSQVMKCMHNVARQIRDCCIPYDFTAVGKPLNGCNSNCAAWWIASNCFSPLASGSVIDLPRDRPKGCLGWKKPIPKCVSDPNGKREPNK